MEGQGDSVFTVSAKSWAGFCLDCSHMPVPKPISVAGKRHSSPWPALGHVTSAKSCDHLGDGEALKTTKSHCAGKREQGVLTKGKQREKIKESREGFCYQMKKNPQRLTSLLEECSCFSHPFHPTPAAPPISSCPGGPTAHTELGTQLALSKCLSCGGT